MKKHKVTINYGPYVSFGLLEYRTARLEGIQGIFEESVEFIIDLRLVTVAMTGTPIHFVKHFRHFI